MESIKKQLMQKHSQNKVNGTNKETRQSKMQSSTKMDKVRSFETKTTSDKMKRRVRRDSIERFKPTKEKRRRRSKTVTRK